MTAPRRTQPSKHLRTALALIGATTLATVLAAPSASAAPGDTVTFTDTTLKNCVAQELGVPQDSDITEGQLATLTYLRCTGTSSIEPLQYATSLTTLTISEGSLSDLSPLADLTTLTYLDFNESQVADLSPVAGLTNLTQLVFFTNRVSDLTPLTNLTQLTKLWADDNAISDISPIANLTTLEDLDLHGNAISDISSLAGLTNLQKLDFGYNDVSDITPIAGMTQLVDLRFDANQISDISVLSAMPNLELLEIAQNQITDMSPISGLTIDHYGYDHQAVQCGATVGTPIGVPTITAQDGSQLSVVVAAGNGTIDGDTVTWSDDSDPSQLTWGDPDNYTEFSGTISYVFDGSIEAGICALPEEPVEPPTPEVPGEPDPASPDAPNSQVLLPKTGR